MASLEDIVAATKILSEDSETAMGGSGSKPKENGASDSDVMKDDGGSAAVLGEKVVVTRTVVETKTVVESKTESIVDDESDLDNDLVVEEKGKTSTENLSTVEEPTVNGSSDKKFAYNEEHKDFDDSSANSGQMNGNERDTMDLDMDGGINGEEFKNDDNGFRVGDFVWGKIKSHPWWPGQIYDPKDASEFAMKHKIEGRYLVAFFGDGSCSWCSPSQLKPFVENFIEMSRNSSSKSFLNAVEKAVDEIGRVLESDMGCKDSLVKPVVTNAGIKGGVLVPEVDVSRLSVPKYEPKELIEKVRKLAKEVSVGSALELAILRSWLSAFYYFRGGYQLAVYHEPLYIEGLEDKNKTRNEFGDDFSVPIEVPILRPHDEDSMNPSDDKVFHKRKQKSVAELMGESKSIKNVSGKRAKVKEANDSEKSKKRKKNSDGEMKEAEILESSSARKKRKTEASESTPKITRKEKISKDEDAVKGASSLKNIKKPEVIEVAADAEEDTSGETKEELEILSSPRERKLSKYLSPPYTNLAWRIGNSSFKTAQVIEHQTEEKLSDDQVEDLDISDDTNRQTVKNGKKLTIPISDVDVPVNELLSELRFTAVDPFYLSNKGSIDTVFAFVSALRSSTYLHGPNYKIYHKSKKDGKRLDSPQPHLGNDETTTKEKSAETSGAKSNAEMKNEGKKVLPCLVLEFTPGFPLPSKKHILKLFGKFGSLNAMETKVMTDSHSVKIVYLKDSCAEAAFRASVTKNPFGSENVSYKLQRSKKASSSPKWDADERYPIDDVVSDGRVVKQKFEIMAAILENYHSKFSTEDKSSLKDEMQRLMEKVDAISEKVRIMAENTSS